MKDPLGVSPSKENQGTTRGKEKILYPRPTTHDLRIRSTVTLSTELRSRTKRVGDDLGGESRRRQSKVRFKRRTLHVPNLISIWVDPNN